LKRAHTGDVSSVTYDPAGERIASGSADTTVKVWRANGELLSTLSGAKLAITQVEFAPGGDMVLASSCDAVARLWNLSNAKIKHTLTGHVGKVPQPPPPSPLLVLTCCRDGQVMGATFVSAEKIVTGSQDRTVKVPPAHTRTQSVDGSCPSHSQSWWCTPGVGPGEGVLRAYGVLLFALQCRGRRGREHAHALLGPRGPPRPAVGSQDGRPRGRNPRRAI
jgi:WD40 repeat protein